MKPQILIILALSMLILPYQNCANKVEFQSDYSATSSLGDDIETGEVPTPPEEIPPITPEIPNDEMPPIVENEDEEEYDPSCHADDSCDDKEEPIVDNTPSADQCSEGKYELLVHDGDEKWRSIGAVDAYQLDTKIKNNIRYHSASIKLLAAGPKIVGKNAKLFLIEGTDGLALHIVFNQDGGGSKDNKIKWHIFNEDESHSDDIIFMEDPKHKADKIKVVRQNKGSLYDIEFRYFYNTDSIVIGPLNKDRLDVLINPMQTGDAVFGAALLGPNDGHLNIADNSKQTDRLSKFKIVNSNKESCAAEITVYKEEITE